MADAPVIQIVGVDALLQNYAVSEDRIQQALMVALREIGEELMTAAKQLCPVRYGALRASGLAHAVERDGDSLREVLSFGNDAVDYAIYVHENLNAHHNVGQAKFLEQPIMDAATSLTDRIAESLRAQLGLAA